MAKISKPHTELASKMIRMIAWFKYDVVARYENWKLFRKSGRGKWGIPELNPKAVRDVNKANYIMKRTKKYVKNYTKIYYDAIDAQDAIGNFMKAFSLRTWGR